jgi:hypothetical protein
MPLNLLHYPRTNASQKNDHVDLTVIRAVGKVDRTLMILSVTSRIDGLTSECHRFWRSTAPSDEAISNARAAQRR